MKGSRPQTHHQPPKLMNPAISHCGKTTSYEAVLIFYSKSTFAFEQQHNWDPLVSWLGQIEAGNLNNLAKLEINRKELDHVW